MLSLGLTALKDLVIETAGSLVVPMEGSSLAGGLVGIHLSSLPSVPQRSCRAPEHAAQLEAPSWAQWALQALRLPGGKDTSSQK